MANEEHLAILLQGVLAWNKWRSHNFEVFQPDLSGAKLSKKALRSVNLSNTVLFEASLSWSDLSYANLSGSNLSHADLSSSDLRGSTLHGSDLSYAKLRSASLKNVAWVDSNLANVDLRDADLTNSTLRETNFREASFNRAILRGVYLSGGSLRNTDFEKAIIGQTSFSNLDLSLAENLHLVRHDAPSTIGLDTLIKSKGKIPIEFLEGAGVPKHIIENMQYLVDIPTIQYYSCFISYSTKDDDFAHQLNDRMKRDGLRVWFAPEEMKGGQKIHEQLYEAIRYHDKLILVLSEASMNSNWVQSEIRRARKHEREDKRRKLFPISLVPFGEIQKWELFDGDEGRDLAQEIREYYIPDFSQWKNYDTFNTEFDKLLKALRAED